MEQVSCSHSNLKEMIQYLFHAKYLGSKEIPDDIFLKNIIEVLEKYKQEIKQIVEYSNKTDIVITNSKAPINENSGTTDAIITNSEAPINKTKLYDNTVELKSKKYLIIDSKAYIIKKDGTKGRLFGTFTNNQVVKTQPKSKEIVV